MTFEAIRKIALALDDVEEATSYGTPAFKVGGAMIARLRDDIGALVVRTRSIEERDELIVADPETYFIIEHYLKYPYILVSLARAQPDAMRDLLRGAWKVAAAEKKSTSKKKRPRR
jgi:hypothetical protein